MYIPKSQIKRRQNMVLHFNVKGEARKAMVRAIEEETGISSHYMGMPTAAYEIGDYRVGRNGELEFSGQHRPCGIIRSHRCMCHGNGGQPGRMGTERRRGRNERTERTCDTDADDERG